MSRRHNINRTKGVVTCPQPRCGGTGGVEDTDSLNAWFIRRTRGCNKCGHVWSTAEIPLPMLKHVLKVDNFLRSMGVANGSK